MLASARSRLSRVTPREAIYEMALGATLVDIRPAAQRAASGEVPGSWIVERNHLEWRFDPACEARLPWVSRYDHRIIVICAEGYTSSLAAAALQDLGLHRATDVAGGFAAWTESGLPTAPASDGTAAIAPGASAAAAVLLRTWGGRRVGRGRSRRDRSGWRRPVPAWACGHRATTGR
jgi:rhodanese-related sulfurtransferase